MSYIKGQDRNQLMLFPESIDEYIKEYNSVRVIEEYVKQLDLKELGFVVQTVFSFSIYTV